MRTKIFFLMAVTGALWVQGAAAQDIPRIKARIISFDGKMLTVTSGTAGQNMEVGLIPGARLMYEEKIEASTLKPGDYLGATLARSGSKWEAQEIHLLPEAFHGAGEGLYPLPSAPDQRIVTGAVSRNDAGALALSFRGSVGSNGPTCTGRAPRQGGCTGEIAFSLNAKAPVVAIKQGDKSILVAGKVAAISVVAGPNGRLVTPGLTIENETGGEIPEAAPPKPGASKSAAKPVK
jgi:hypothetical protein